MTRPTLLRPLVAALALFVASATVACSDEESASTTTTTQVTIPTTTIGRPPPDAEVIPLTDLEAGQCFNQVEDALARPFAVLVFGCEAPHQYEVYGIAFYDGAGSGRGAPYPGEPAVRDWAEQYCYDGFQPFVGVAWTESELELDTWWPSPESWARGDRKVVCTVTDRSGDALEGTAAGLAR